MNRRFFLFSSAAAVAAAALPIPISAMAPAAALPPLPIGFLVPSGEKMMIVSDTGLIEATGQTLPIANYPVLYAKVRDWWGSQHGLYQQTFTVADLRGWVGKPELFPIEPGTVTERTVMDIWNDSVGPDPDLPKVAEIIAVPPHRNAAFDDQNRLGWRWDSALGEYVTKP